MLTPDCEGTRRDVKRIVQVLGFDFPQGGLILTFCIEIEI